MTAPHRTAPTSRTTARHCVIDGALGELTVVADHDSLIGIYFPQHWTNPSTDDFGPRVDASSDPLLDRAGRQLDEYLTGGRTAFDLPIDPHGDAFQHQVWKLLMEIPYGATTTYGALAERLGNKALAQRVGQCVGHNPLSVVIPCHRVVGSDGSLTGYAGGLDRKRFLLGLEEPDEARAARLF
ncbi:methylated-DNA--[protein]-cysteine S-methyltransferase [Leekyejoonella antrihumi]|uniref:Methylated-DNA--protein-cysteine methyltransferase n=1 Tax=Leekyejoonella antrihumi TaxID=1660198 RepID=A0A563EB74_9MICO|nr:methylated-DNA--[protein]-cysteine S-methyltransferase [Leekyejoonella antrihumi]TWP39034.1 methylated-DNA--[protein]-cysteine S-methyltransferase [Leekyejoonella antrihumi]